MRTIKTTATVNDGGVLTVEVPVDIEPGEYEVAIVVDEQPVRETDNWLDKIQTWSWDAWPAGSRFGRDEIYDDDGRQPAVHRYQHPRLHERLFVSLA